MRIIPFRNRHEDCDRAPGGGQVKNTFFERRLKDEVEKSVYKTIKQE